jgi:signal transduction histidine kinase
VVFRVPRESDARAARGGQNAGMRALDAARRHLAGPDGPWTLAIALSLGALLQLSLIEGGENSIIANLLETLPLALTRRRLLPAAWMTTAGTWLVLADDVASFTLAGIAAQVIVAYLVASRRRRLASGLLALPFLFAAVAAPRDQGHFSTVLLLALVIGALAFGDARRQRGQAIAERDATRRAMSDTLRDQAATQERARIARELHDVVAHHVSMVAVQAETARLTTPGMPPEGRERLAAIGDTARDALTEMRRLLGVLRADVAGEAERAPQPGLARLDELVEGARVAGTTVRLVVSGDVVALPAGIDLTAYRIVQEALTNARRHAPGAEVDVEVQFRDRAVHVRVSDNGPGAAGTGDGGHGLTGMHERVAMVGGGLRVGPADGGGFAVEAHLPIGGAAT